MLLLGASVALGMFFPPALLVAIVAGFRYRDSKTITDPASRKALLITHLMLMALPVLVVLYNASLWRWAEYLIDRWIIVVLHVLAFWPVLNLALLILANREAKGYAGSPPKESE